MRSCNAMIGDSVRCINTMSLFSMLVLIFFVSSVHCGILTEEMVLLAFKECMSDTFNLTSSWTGRNTDNCTLIGVSCNSNHSVRVLCLSGNYSISPYDSMSFDFPLHHFGIRINCSCIHENLVGNLPPVIGELRVLSSLGNCIQLTTLLLSSNALNGRIPRKFCKLKKLEILDIFGNGLRGPAPSELGKCANLLVRNLSSLFARPRTAHDLCEHFLEVFAPSVPAPFVFVLVAQKLINGSQDSSLSGRHNHSYESSFIVSAIALLSILLFLVVFNCKSHKGSNSSIPIPEPSHGREVTIVNDVGVPLTYGGVIQATGNFASTNCVGIGGFSTVYRAEVSSGTVVAVKRFSHAQEEGKHQFLAEVSILRRLSHPFIVTLIGFHLSVNEMFLIYNYISGGNLEKYIQEREKKLFCWIKLYKISLHIASAVSWLHNHFTPQILHRDLKPNNILLDDDGNAYLSDFGLSMFLSSSDGDAPAEVVGTYAYVAPEYAMESQVSDKIDVYSYGVTLLELMSEKTALDPSFESYENGFNIVSWARLQSENGNEMDVFVSVLREHSPEDKLLEMLHLALMCTAESPTERPRMAQVVKMLTALGPDST